MHWQLNQGHALVVERARAQNNMKQGKIPNKVTILTIFVIAWGLLWLLSMLVYGTKAWMKYKADSKWGEDNNGVYLLHDHTSLKESKLIREIKPIVGGGAAATKPCTISTAQPRFGYLPCLLPDCSLQSYPTLQLASEACLAAAESCSGVTFVPWEERYELRQSTTLQESFDGQVSYTKRC